jgi:hypothetical protein
MAPRTYLPGLLILSSLLFGSPSTQGQDTKKDKDEEKTAALKTLVESRHYEFLAQSATPMTGRPRQLSGEYSLIVTKESIFSYLPYYGRAYSAPIDPSQGGIQFTSKDFEYTAKPRDNGGWDVQIKPKDQRDVSKMMLGISSSGYATLQVTSPNRQPISFYGQIRPVKQNQ